ncbi:hypothetical protein D3C86_994970 [compost metagenome]
MFSCEEVGKSSVCHYNIKIKNMKKPLKIKRFEYGKGANKNLLSEDLKLLTSSFKHIL